MYSDNTSAADLRNLKHDIKASISSSNRELKSDINDLKRQLHKIESDQMWSQTLFYFAIWTISILLIALAASNKKDTKKAEDFSSAFFVANDISKIL